MMEGLITKKRKERKKLILIIIQTDIKTKIESLII